MGPESRPVIRFSSCRYELARCRIFTIHPRFWNHLPIGQPYRRVFPIDETCAPDHVPPRSRRLPTPRPSRSHTGSRSAHPQHIRFVSFHKKTARKGRFLKVNVIQIILPVHTSDRHSFPAPKYPLSSNAAWECLSDSDRRTDTCVYPSPYKPPGTSGYVRRRCN